MILSTFLSTCALALTANAVLVPPQLEAADVGNADQEFWEGALPIIAQEERQSVTLGCKSCPVAIGNGDNGPTEWKTGAETELQISFTVRDGKQLLMNGVPFYPVTTSNIAQSMHVKQVYAGDEAKDFGEIFEGSIPISTSVVVHPQTKAMSFKVAEIKEGKNPFITTEMRRLSFEVLGLADKVIHVNTIEVRFSEDNDKLTLFGASITPYSKHSTPEGDACTTVFCRVRVLITSKLSAMREMAAKKMGHFRKACHGAGRKMGFGPHHHHMPADGTHGPSTLHGGFPKFGGDATLAPGGRNHPHGPFVNKSGEPGYRSHHHHHMHRFAHFVRHIILPVFIGIVAGMAVSGLAMIVGQIVALIYLRFRRRGGKHAYQSVEQVDASLEKGDLESPPMYEDVCEKATQVADEKESS